MCGGGLGRLGRVSNGEGEEVGGGRKGRKEEGRRRDNERKKEKRPRLEKQIPRGEKRACSRFFLFDYGKELEVVLKTFRLLAAQSPRTDHDPHNPPIPTPPSCHSQIHRKSPPTILSISLVIKACKAPVKISIIEEG